MKEETLPLQHLNPYRMPKIFFFKEKTETAIEAFVWAYNSGKPLKEQIRSAGVLSYVKLLDYFEWKYKSGQTRSGRITITMGYLAKEISASVRTAYNQVARLLKAGVLISKQLAVDAFGSNHRRLCIELEFKKNLMKFDDPFFNGILRESLPLAAATVDKPVENLRTAQEAQDAAEAAKATLLRKFAT